MCASNPCRNYGGCGKRALIWINLPSFGHKAVEPSIAGPAHQVELTHETIDARTFVCGNEVPAVQ